jgi:hypothetical protein
MSNQYGDFTISKKVGKFHYIFSLLS